MNACEIIKNDCLHHPLQYFFTWLKQNKSELVFQNIVFENLTYFYQIGYKQFEINEWGKKFKIDYKDKNLTKGHSALIQALYNLCKECHALQDISRVRVPFSNAYRWFAYSILELIWCDLNEMVLEESEGRRDIEIWKNRLNILKSLEYPREAHEMILYNPFLKNDTQALSLLIESAYTLSVQNPTFNEKYWKPFLDAQRNIIKILESDTSNLIQVRLLPQTLEFQSKSNHRKSKFKNPRKLGYK